MKYVGAERSSHMVAVRSGLALAIVMLMTPQLWADNDVRVTWAKPGKKAGTIEIQGIVTTDDGWAATSGATLDVWQDGCQVSSFRLSLAGKRPNYTFSFTASELVSGATYNVVVDVVFTDKAKKKVTYKSQPTTSVAK